MDWWTALLDGLTGQGAGISGILGSGGRAVRFLWRQITRAVYGLQFILTHPVNDVFNAASLLAGIFTGNMRAMNSAFNRLEGHYTQSTLKPNLARLQAEITALQHNFWLFEKAIYQWIAKVNATTRAWAVHLIRKERRARIRAFRLAEAYTRQRVQWALGLVQREAASAYDATIRDRMGIISDLADNMVTRNPLVKDLVKHVVDAVIGLAEIDDPILRLAIGFIVKEIIDRLGIDKAMGVLLSDLIAPLLGQGKPRNLHAVILQLADRMNNLEAEWSMFMQNGGPEILQAGDEWRDITNPVTDAGLALFFGAMVASPETWARDVTEIFSPVVGGAITAVSVAMSEWR